MRARTLPIERTWPLKDVVTLLQVHRTTIYRYMRQYPEVFGVVRLRRVKKHPRKHRALTETEIQFLSDHIHVKKFLFPS
jgi:hypothetical protein